MELIMKSITYQNTLDDIYNYYHHWIFNTTEGQKWLKQTHWGVQIFFLILALVIWGLTRNLGFAATLWFVFDFIWLAKTKFRPKQVLAESNIKRWLKPFTGIELENFTSPKILDVSEDNLTIRNNKEAHSFNWSRIRGVDNTSNNIIIYCGMRSLFIVPRSSFDSQSQFDELFQELTRRVINPSSVASPTIEKMIYG